ncbi:hypothetical protein niasHS_001914 [Heterodera schachtii]|uniref:BTB domain-containing protein n=1 Tax=Heterodera schachtii TaxID=97005 RepID=A0ABD2KAW8_HETSC
MSKLLSTGAYADVQFLVEEGDKKEAKSAETIKTVLVTDVPIEAFKVMLSFIYTEDLKGLTAQNLLGVLFAAKKYKIIGLINACVAFPISQFSNVFKIIAEARVLDMDFAQCCLQYIDENAHSLFLSENFLQIDNEFLTEILSRDQLKTKGGELEIWQAALRWADAQCRRNGTECSAEKRRAALGQALFEIRFPLIKKEDFTLIIVPSGVLTSEEVNSVYQFDPNAHGLKKKNPTKFPIGKRTEKQKKKLTFLHEIENHYYGLLQFRASNDVHSLSYRMKELLRNATFADVKFRIEDGKKIIILPAHKAIISVASVPLEALMHFEASKMDDAAEKTLDQSIAITNMSISAFNVLLQFIYAVDFSGLNGQNWAEVINAAKMYELNGLVEACVTFPISQLPNIFDTIELARLLELEELINHCLDYIDANFETVIRTNEFLQIDQQLLCQIFGRETLQINGEISLWNAALRWADAQCGRNGTECSGENRRTVLGAAVNKIRLPLISKEIFTEDIAPSGVLTQKEVISIYQFHAHPDLIGAPGGLPPLPFPAFLSREKAHLNNLGGTLRLEIGKFSEFARGPIGSERLGEHMFIRGIPLQILAVLTEERYGPKYLGLFIKIKAPVAEGEWTLKCNSTFRMLSQSFFSKNFEQEFTGFILNNKSTTKGDRHFRDMDIKHFTAHGSYNKKKDKVNLEIAVDCSERTN